MGSLNLALLLLKIAEAYLANLLKALPRIFGRTSGNGGSGSNKNNDTTLDDNRDPFEVLGLKGGRENTTLEEATKARRKLALKWHPDRNIDNAEEATRQMQAINHAYHQIEQILSNSDNDDDHDDNEYVSDHESDSESDNRARRKAKSKKARRKEAKRRYDEEAEFEREIEEEMAKFQRAQRNAERGSFAQATPTSYASASATRNYSQKDHSQTDNPKRKKGVKGKGKSKAAKRRAKKRGANNDTGSNERQCSSANENPSNDISNSTTPVAAKSIPLHQLPKEKRCSIKFHSACLIKCPIFTAMYARTYNVLHIVTMVLKVTDPVPLPSEEKDNGVFVTPLMVACYLGDYRAADILITNAEDDWSEAVLATCQPAGEDCLSLAMEARDIAQQLYDESKAHYCNIHMGEDLESLENDIVRLNEELEMANNLVERMESLKKFALEKRRRDNIHMWTGYFILGLIGVGCYYFYGWIKVLFAIVWMPIRFCLMMVKYGIIFVAFCVKPGLVGIILFIYYYYTKEPASSPSSDPTLKPAVDIPSSKAGDFIDIFCTDGEDCLTEGVSCTDGISEDVCKCGADLKYVCSINDGCLGQDCEIQQPNGHVEPPSNMPTAMNKVVDVNVDPTGIFESAGVGICLSLMIGGMLYSFHSNGGTVRKKEKKKRN